MIATLNTLASIAWDPQIRGILAVATGVLVLVGSVYLLLGTNTGARVGFMIAMAGLFGWLTMLGLMWWIYAKGLAGEPPAWEIEEINVDRAGQVQTEVVETLPPYEGEVADSPVELPTGEEVLLEVLAAEQGHDVSVDDLDDLDSDILDALYELKGDDVSIEELTLTDMATLEAQLEVELLEDSESLDLGEWHVVAESDPARGEAVATADAELAALQDTLATETGLSDELDEFIVVDVFITGGKEPPASDSTWDRVANRIWTTLQVKNPPQYAVVTVVPASTIEVAAGEQPLPPEAIEGSPTYSVVMLRNLGNERVVSAAFTVVCAIVFVVFVYMLHSRDRRQWAQREQYEETTGG